MQFVHLSSCSLMHFFCNQIHITISKSAQEKMRQKQTREMELLLREREKERAKEKSLQFSTWSTDPGGVAGEGEWLL